MPEPIKARTTKLNDFRNLCTAGLSCVGGGGLSSSVGPAGDGVAPAPALQSACSSARRTSGRAQAHESHRTGSQHEVMV